VVPYTSSDGQLVPGTLMGTRSDGGPTSWAAAIINHDVEQGFHPKPGFEKEDNSYREFLLEFQDSALAYENASRTTTGAPVPASDNCRIPNQAQYVTDLNMGTIGSSLASAINNANCFFNVTQDTKVYTLFQTKVGATPYEFNWVITLVNGVYVIGLEQNTSSSNLRIWQMSSLFTVNNNQQGSVTTQDMNKFISELDNGTVDPLLIILFGVNGITLNTKAENGPQAGLVVTPRRGGERTLAD
jgi:hypothetical protein